MFGKRIFAKLAMAAFALVITASVAAAALQIDAAKQNGLVGEKPDGMIGAVSASPSADVTALVNSINSQRMQKYTAIAEKNNTPVDQVQAVAGQNLISNTPAGQYIMNGAGEWQKK